jgi:methyl-accepting chemotaxis protein WspA
MKNWSVRNKIVASFAVVIATLVVMGGLGYARLVDIERQERAIRTDTLAGLQLSAEMRNAAAEDYARSVDFALQLNAEERKQDIAAIDAERSTMGRLSARYEATITQPADRAVFVEFQDNWRNYEAVQTEVFSAEGGAAAVKLEADLQPVYVKVMATAERLVERNSKEANEALGDITKDVRTLELGMGITVVMAILLALGAGLALLAAITNPLKRLGEVMNDMRQGDFTRRVEVDRTDELGQLSDGFNRMAEEVMLLVGQVQRSGIQVNTSLTEIAATSKQQQATAGEIAATTTEIGATSKEISATSKELVKAMGEVSSVAEQTAALAGDGQTGLANMELTMQHVMEAAGSINAKLATLNEKAGNINQVVTTITKVADQTNLLSLNAAIEAEKAGEYGRGFAVVAAEIRRLADQTAIATYDIEQMVKEIQSAISAGVMGMDKFSEEVRNGMENVEQVGGQLSQIIHQVQALVPNFETVNDGMQAQATGAEQISEALLQLTEAAQQTVESLQQSTAAIDELNQVSGNLRSSVSRFKLHA